MQNAYQKNKRCRDNAKKHTKCTLQEKQSQNARNKCKQHDKQQTKKTKIMQTHEKQTQIAKTNQEQYNHVIKQRKCKHMYKTMHKRLPKTENDQK